MMTGTKKATEAASLRDIEVGQDCSVSNKFHNQYTTCKSVCKPQTAYTGSAAVGYNKQQLLFACIDQHGGTATQTQIIAAFKRAGFRPQQARDAIHSATVLRDVQVFQDGLEFLVQRQTDLSAAESRKRLVPVEVSE